MSWNFDSIIDTIIASPQKILGMRYSEKLCNVNLESILEVIESNDHLKKFMNTEISEFPPKIRYSIGDMHYQLFKNRTPLDYMKYAFNSTGNSKLLISQQDQEVLGWIAFDADLRNGALNNIKFGVFYLDDTEYDRLQRLKFMKEFKDFFKGMLDNKVSLVFAAKKKNPFTKHYYELLKTYPGYVEGEENLVFHIYPRDHKETSSGIYLRETLRKASF